MTKLGKMEEEEVLGRNSKLNFDHHEFEVPVIGKQLDK